MIWGSTPRFQSYEEALIRACYQVLLGREPEPAVSITQTAPRLAEREERRLEEILRRFIESEEFRTGRDGVIGQPLLPIEGLVQGTRLEVEDRIRALCQTTYLGNQTALCRILGRFHFFVHTSDVGFATHILHRGIWEMWLTEFMVRTIKPGMRVLDIGGNFGYYSVLMSDLVQSYGHCHVFEPNQKIAQLLKQSLDVNGFTDRSKVWEIALSNRENDSVHFFIPHTEPKNAHLVAGVDDSLSDIGYFTEVPIRSLDSMKDEIGPIDFVKIDTEGAELDILAGMRNIIREQKPVIVVEVNAGRNYDLAPVLREYRDIYGSINFIDDDGFSRRASIEDVLTKDVGVDWLIHFDRSAAPN